jgi:hypothetical protein
MSSVHHMCGDSNNHRPHFHRHAQGGRGASSTGKKRTPSGLTGIWRFGRNYCCRYGWYPLLVAPLVTAGCVLSMYSAGGCDFLRVHVGFTPSNSAWNESSIELGLFLYQSRDEETNKYRAAFLEGCRGYSDDFVESFIEDDRTWSVSRIMAYVAGGASILASVSDDNPLRSLVCEFRRMMTIDSCSRGNLCNKTRQPHGFLS